MRRLLIVLAALTLTACATAHKLDAANDVHALLISIRDNDQSAQRGSSVKMSSRTLVSTSVTSIVAAKEGHDLVGRHPSAKPPTNGLKSALAAFVPGFDENDVAVGVHIEIDDATRLDAQRIAHALGNGHLPFAGDTACHVFTSSNTNSMQGITSGTETQTPGGCRCHVCRKLITAKKWL